MSDKNKHIELEDLLEAIAPTSLYEEDNSGIQIDCGRENTERVLVCLEINDDIIDEAIEKNADMIITHHPLLFYPVYNVTPNTPTGRYVIKLIKAGIGVYSSHLPFDAAFTGNNAYLAKLLNLSDVPESNSCSDEIGGVGSLPEPMDFTNFVEYVEKCLDLPKNYVRCVDGGSDSIEKIAYCTGAGGEFVYRAVELGCDAYITGDVRLHEAQYAKAMGLTVVDAGHYGTEKIFTENMASLLREAAAVAGMKLDVIEAESNTNPYTL